MLTSFLEQGELRMGPCSLVSNWWDQLQTTTKPSTEFIKFIPNQTESINNRQTLFLATWTLLLATKLAFFQIGYEETSHFKVQFPPAANRFWRARASYESRKWTHFVSGCNISHLGASGRGGGAVILSIFAVFTPVMQSCDQWSPYHHSTPVSVLFMFCPVSSTKGRGSSKCHLSTSKWKYFSAKSNVASHLLCDHLEDLILSS